jgi:hypothetical protein
MKAKLSAKFSTNNMRLNTQELEVPIKAKPKGPTAMRNFVMFYPASPGWKKHPSCKSDSYSVPLSTLSKNSLTTPL